MRLIFSSNYLPISISTFAENLSSVSATPSILLVDNLLLSSFKSLKLKVIFFEVMQERSKDSNSEILKISHERKINFSYYLKDSWKQSLWKPDMSPWNIKRSEERSWAEDMSLRSGMLTSILTLTWVHKLWYLFITQSWDVRIFATFYAMVVFLPFF